jgi:protein-S-isoprenylcysteine O-methyltransferase Ste14
MSDLSIFWLSYFLLLAFGLVVLRIIVRREYLRRGRLSKPVSLLQSALFFIYGGFPAIYLNGDWPVVHVAGVVHLLGIAFIIIGLASLFYGMIRLGILRSVGRGEEHLELMGIYRRTRNPQALACGLYVVGFTILWPSWQALAWVILYFVFIHIMIITEEEHLLRIHGDKYEQYCQEVPRYFGFDSFSP